MQCSHNRKIYFSKKNPLQDLHSSLNAIISTNERHWIITDHVIFKLRYNKIYQLKTVLKSGPRSSWMTPGLTAYCVLCIWYNTFIVIVWATPFFGKKSDTKSRLWIKFSALKGLFLTAELAEVLFLVSFWTFSSL